MKKILTITLAVTLVFALLSACAPAAPAASSPAASSPAASSEAPSQSASAAPSESPSASASASAAADESLKKIKDKGTFVLGFDEAFPPMGFKDKDGEYKGFDIDMAKEFVKKLDVELKLQPIDWNSKELELNSGKIDCIWNGFSITDERKQALSFGKPYMANKQVFVVKADSAIKTMKDLAGKTVITQEKSAAYDAIMANAELSKSLKELVQVSDYVKAWTELDADAVDCIAIDEIYARYYFTQTDVSYSILKENLGSEQYGVGFRKDDIALTEEWNKIYGEMISEGTAKTISEKWFGEDILLK